MDERDVLQRMAEARRELEDLLAERVRLRTVATAARAYVPLIEAADADVDRQERLAAHLELLRRLDQLHESDKETGAQLLAHMETIEAERDRLRAVVEAGNAMMGTMRGPGGPANEDKWLAFELALACLANDGLLDLSGEATDGGH